MKDQKKPIEEITKENEVERLSVELKAMRGTANAYKMHYERAKRDAEALAAELANVSEIGVDLEKTVARKIFGYLKGGLKDRIKTLR